MHCRAPVGCWLIVKACSSSLEVPLEHRDIDAHGLACGGGRAPAFLDCKCEFSSRGQAIQAPQPWQVVDEVALVTALKTGALAAAAIDVFSPEPLPQESPLWDAPNLLLTPHVAGLTEESSRRMSVEAVEETIRILNFQRPLSLVNPIVWENYVTRFATVEQSSEAEALLGVQAK